MSTNPDPEAAFDFLARWHPSGPWCVCHKARDVAWRQEFPQTEDELRDHLFELAEIQEVEVYFGINLMRAGRKGRETADLAKMRAVHVDCDPPKGLDAAGLEEWRVDALARLAEHRPQPSLIVDSGRGLWGYWVLEEPVDVGNEEVAHHLAGHNYALVKALAADACQDLVHVGRLPGFVNTRTGRVANVLGDHSDWSRRHHLGPGEGRLGWAEPPRCAGGSGEEIAIGEAESFDLEELEDGDDLRLRMIAEHGHSELPLGEDLAIKDVREIGDRSTHLFDLCCNMARRGFSSERILYAITNRDWQVSHSVYHERKGGGFRQRANPRGYAQKQIRNALTKVAAVRSDDLASAATEGARSFATDDNGHPYKSQENIRIALERIGVRLAYNEFTRKRTLSGLEDFDRLNDEAAEHLWLEIERRFYFRPPREYFDTVLRDTARRNAFHPVREYLDGLEWDGTPRIDTWLTTYLGAKDSEYTRAVGRLFLIGAVRRARRPGCKFDEMLVFEGEQGTEKSTVVETLAVRPEWYGDDLPLGADSKVVVERTSGKWIIEAGELQGLRGKNVERLKTFLSSSSDRARLAYGRYEDDYPRHFAIVGTTNNREYLRDLTGNRRYWPIAIGRVDIEALRRDRDQLWAEAARCEAQRESNRLAPELWPAAAEQQAKRRAEDPWTETLRGRLTFGAGCMAAGRITTDDVWRLVGKRPEHRTQEDNERLGTAVRSLGFERIQGGGGRWYYARGNPEQRKHRIWLRWLGEEESTKKARKFDVVVPVDEDIPF